jgi:T5orf172 domain
MTHLLSIEQTLQALPVRKSRRWLVEFLHRIQTDPDGRPLYRLAGRDKLIYLDRLIEALGIADAEAQKRKENNKENNPGYIYFVKSGEFIKIGYSRSLEARFHKLRTDVPVALELLHIEQGSVKQEKCFHRRFAAIRSRGEWFHHRPELLAFIEERKQIAAGPA